MVLELSYSSFPLAWMRVTCALSSTPHPLLIDSLLFSLFCFNKVSSWDCRRLCHFSLPFPLLPWHSSLIFVLEKKMVIIEVIFYPLLIISLTLIQMVIPFQQLILSLWLCKIFSLLAYSFFKYSSSILLTTTSFSMIKLSLFQFKCFILVAQGFF